MERSKWITVFLISLLLFSLLFCVVIFDFNSSNGEILDNYSISERNQVSLLDSAESLTSNDSSNDKILFFDTRSSYNDFIQNEEFETAYYNLKAIRTKSLDFTRNYEMTVFPDVYNKLELHQSSEVRSFYGVDDLLNIQEIWDMGYFGNNITVGVLDNGIKTDLSSFENQVAHTEFMGIPSIAPCYNHGTPVSGIIAGDENPSNLPIGIAKDASLVDIQFSCNGATIEGDFLGAFEYVLSQNDTIDIINTSFGGFAPTWDPIIRQLESVGIITVGSAGNSGPSSHSTTTGGPGNSVHAISVGSINSNLGVSTFSSSGPAHYMTQKPDLLAPGESIASISHNGGSGSFTGTSFSSPIVAGSIAVLLSALQAQNITYNPGLIKSSLLESATPVEGDQLRTGAGIPNILDAFNLIQNNSELVSLAPNSAPLSYLQSVPRGQIIKIPISLISSNPLTTTLDFSGDLNGITISYNISNDYSQQIILEIDTTQFSSNTDVTGSLTANVGDYSSSIDLSFHITEDAVGTLGIDLTHTFWDQFGANHIGGSNIGKMIELAMTNGIKVVEISDPLTDVILQDLDILWMPDPLNIIDPSNSYSTDYLFEEQPLSTDEINNLLDFVNNGKDLVISSLGLQYPERTQTSRLSGTNATAVNMLTGNFGIELSDDPLYLGSSNSKSLILNQSSLAKGVDEITHIGNYLSIDETKAWVLAQENGRPTLVCNQSDIIHPKICRTNYNLT